MNATQELDYRYTRELEKAVEKYGEAAMAEAGHPDKDIHDYAINEVVGLIRYGEMIENRLALLDQTSIRAAHVVRRGIRNARELQEFAARLARDLIQDRQALLANGYLLGETEAR